MLLHREEEVNVPDLHENARRGWRRAWWNNGAGVDDRKEDEGTDAGITFQVEYI